REDDSGWVLGVSRDSVNRKGYMDLRSEDVIMRVLHCFGQFQFLTSPPTPLSVSQVPSRVWVCLDCPQGLVTFINADFGVKIF
ncbi:TRI15 protein, partial [Zapornia atra]|nr:TRI15 protein [Zapornia atra]